MSPAEILALARQRASERQLAYAGALLPAEAWLLVRQAGGRLIDVRTRAEWEWVGRVPGSIEVEWNTWPAQLRNPDFLAQLADLAERDAIAMFLCRSGVRSHHAATAATQIGFAQCFNALQGFEGDKDASGHRNTVGGWRLAGLSWVQG